VPAGQRGDRLHDEEEDGGGDRDERDQVVDEVAVEEVASVDRERDVGGLPKISTIIG
jgi:hypothetical protein